MVWLDREESVTPGTYLGTLASLVINAWEPYSPLNLPEPIVPHNHAAPNVWRASNPLMIADAGLLNLFLDESGAVRWTGHCAT